MYPDVASSVVGYYDFITQTPRYAGVVNNPDYENAVYCLIHTTDGLPYATSPTYTTTLINTIKKYNLDAWDREVLGNTAISTPVLNQPTLKIGSKGEEVKAWQTFLNANGYSWGLGDGIFGKNTELAVKQWQVAHGLKADGVIGPKTWASLQLS